MRRDSLGSCLLHISCSKSERIWISEKWFHVQEVMHTGLCNAICISGSLDHELYIAAGFWIKVIVVVVVYHCSLMLCILCIMDTTARRQTCGMFPSHFSLLWEQPAAPNIWTRRRRHSTVSDRTEFCIISTFCQPYLRAHRLHLWAQQRLHWLCELREKCRSQTLYYICVSVFNVIKSFLWTLGILLCLVFWDPHGQIYGGTTLKHLFNFSKTWSRTKTTFNLSALKSVSYYSTLFKYTDRVHIYGFYCISENIKLYLKLLCNYCWYKHSFKIFTLKICK